ncbi:hypothetical protein KIN20_015795 [Parelaphostrongylus tenuis]|uniref:Uncharacterized protein n=1 Tax=Parelaphostrongylus tenuis TaxID=148309 RepID=A0AAD5N4J9_PARTN|nr:hypothetical protein KIN20_015795 [Parelaphostrongylus tenuis]
MLLMSKFAYGRDSFDRGAERNGKTVASVLVLACRMCFLRPKENQGPITAQPQSWQLLKKNQLKFATTKTRGRNHIRTLKWCGSALGHRRKRPIGLLQRKTSKSTLLAISIEFQWA